MRTSLLATGCREKQPPSRRAAFAGVNVLIPHFCGFSKTVVASEMSLPVGGSGNRTLPGGQRQRGGRRKPGGPARGRTGGELARAELWTRPTKRESPKQLRVRSLGTRLSEAEYAQCEKSAVRRGLTTGEWCRQVLLEAAATSPAQEPEAEVILSEILALRRCRLGEAG